MKLLEDNNIRLRAPEPEDLDALYRWENDTTMWALGSTLSPYSRYSIKQYIAEAGNDLFERRQTRLMIELTDSGATAGTIDLYDFEPFHSRAAIGILVDEAFRRKGIASAALTLLTDYAFNFLKIHRLYAFIPKSNTPCLQLFESSAFEQEGVLKDWMTGDNGYTDVTVWALINDR
ncbi:MAG: GNAT family N-acetyltransferase [Tannerella sp.]|jgi:diamine N-acetyltransferase|nr:GNAT family N-acetyltransferase [Tannerella sp.]